MPSANTSDTASQSPIEGALSIEDENQLRRIAYEKLAEGKLDEFQDLAELMRVVSPGDPVFVLLRLVNLARDGHTDTAAQLLDVFVSAYQGAAARLGLDGEARKGIEAAIQTVRSWLPGGKRNNDTRRQLQDEATMWVPRLKPVNGVA